MKTTNQATAAAQSAAAANTTETSTSVENTIVVAETVTPVAARVLRSVPRARVTAAIKVAKTPKRVVGETFDFAITTYNHWRKWVRFIANNNYSISEKGELLGYDCSIEGQHEFNLPIAKFTQTVLAKGTEWGGYISATAENIPVVTKILNDFLAVYPLPVPMWEFMETPTLTIVKERAPRKPKTTEAVVTESTETPADPEMETPADPAMEVAEAINAASEVA